MTTVHLIYLIKFSETLSIWLAITAMMNHSLFHIEPTVYHITTWQLSTQCKTPNQSYLEVSMYNVFLMAVLNCRNNLSELSPGLLFLHSTMCHQIIKHLTYAKYHNMYSNTEGEKQLHDCGWSQSKNHQTPPFSGLQLPPPSIKYCSDLAKCSYQAQSSANGQI